MKKKTLTICHWAIVLGIFCGVTLSVAGILKEEVKVDKLTVTYGEHKKKEIPVTVTLTKYQLSKMLEILEEDNGYGRPADPQDTYTFDSVARGTQNSEEYSISSTHLAKKPIKQ